MRSLQALVMTLLALTFAFTRSFAGLDPWPAWEGSNNYTDREGWSVSTAGDVNGDGFSDVLVSAPSWSVPESDEGGAFVYHGSPTGVASTPNWIGQSNQASAQYGVEVNAAG